MTRGLHRRIALWMLLGLLLQLPGVLQLLAANGSVRGRLTVEGGTPPPGAVVRATPLDGGPASTAALGADLGYQFPQLKEGAYLFELVSPDGRPLGAGTRTLVPPGILQLNLRVKMQPAPAPPPPTQAIAPPPAVPAEPTAPPAAPAQAVPPPVQTVPASQKPPSMNKKKWAIMGTILGSLGVGLAVGNNSNNNKDKDKDHDHNGSECEP